MTYAATNIAGYANAFYPSSFGASGSASFVRRKIQEIARDQLSTGFAQVSYGKTLELIEQVMKDCSGFNWGGEGELPVDPMAKVSAEKFLFLLPNKFHSADVIPEPNGAIALEWRFGPFKSMIISFMGWSRIEYSVLASRTSASFGHCQFYGSIPPELVRQLNSLSRV
jgi:hypothetical protein